MCFSHNVKKWPNCFLKTITKSIHQTSIKEQITISKSFALFISTKMGRGKKTPYFRKAKNNCRTSIDRMDECKEYKAPTKKLKYYGQLPQDFHRPRNDNKLWQKA